MLFVKNKLDYHTIYYRTRTEMKVKCQYSRERIHTSMGYDIFFIVFSIIKSRTSLDKMRHLYLYNRHASNNWRQHAGQRLLTFFNYIKKLSSSTKQNLLIGLLLTVYGNMTCCLNP